MTANSPRARKLEKLAQESRDSAEKYKTENGVGDDDAVVRYILDSAGYYDRRAKHTQQRADQRAR